MMKLPIAAAAFGILSLVCSLAYVADSGGAFALLAIFCVAISAILLGLWILDLIWWARYAPRHDRDAIPPDVDPEEPNERPL